MAPIKTKVRSLQRHLLDGVVGSFPLLGLDKRAQTFVSLFEKRLPKQSFILDIGGGWGFYRDPLRQLGHHVTVLDVVKPGFQKAPVVIYGGGRFPFADHAFDVSLLVTVLHHVKDLDQILQEVRRVTRKRVIVVEDLYHHPLGRLWTILRDQILNFEFFGHPRNFKSRTEWIYFFNRFGFSLLEEKEIYTRVAGLRILNGVFIFEVRENE